MTDLRRPNPVRRSLLAELPANRTGFPEALGGYVVGAVLGTVLVAAFAGTVVSGRTDLRQNVCNLIGLWAGFAVAAVVAARRSGFVGRGPYVTMRDAFGATIRPVDVPLGIAAGLFAQYAVTPVAEAPLTPFVPHLAQRLSDPANSITQGLSTAGLVVIAILVCVGSPVMEELFFRGVILRGVAGTGGVTGVVGRPRAAAAIVAQAVCFGLVHYEALQLPGLIAAGLVFGVLAASTGRLGPGVIAHMTFNAATIVTVVHLF